jgi:excisionase family DNA binding protein
VNADDILLTPAQIVKRYPVSRSTIYAACRDSLLAFYRVPSGRGKRGKYLIKLADFLAWLEANRHEAGEVEDDGELTHIR